ncbi:hypothetical protein RHSIM_Rhsim07G0184000 [Rhododendron simsii]|uniref:DNA-directed DNA polymerase n=1 Tax=Rhododendron simsii TaxID=118357 RepID=A0A834GSD1_RHOSS|nr:hypothetical protein RHSIM_Rhsim07G0184000 [Rhododendron simsii]
MHGMEFGKAYQLPRLLEEILYTRIMVKQAMKKLAPLQQVLHREVELFALSGDLRSLQYDVQSTNSLLDRKNLLVVGTWKSQIFNARQLALKLIANVTYGYTAAGFIGCMPCAELADSIVQCGRRTLENAISFVNSHDRWNAKVIYGDTDSLYSNVFLDLVNFCCFSKCADSFVVLEYTDYDFSSSSHSMITISRLKGREIASAVTAANPNPVTLKIEKIYHSCFLLTKKRYVGCSYESPDPIKPVFDAKAFAKEVRLGTYSTRTSSSLPPVAIVAAKAMRTGPRAEPQYGERVLHVVVHGEPGSCLIDMDSARLCGQCLKNEAAVAIAIIGRTSKLEREIQHLAAVSLLFVGIVEVETGPWKVVCSAEGTTGSFYHFNRGSNPLDAYRIVAPVSYGGLLLYIIYGFCEYLLTVVSIWQQTTAKYIFSNFPDNERQSSPANT